MSITISINTCPALAQGHVWIRVVDRADLVSSRCTHVGCDERILWDPRVSSSFYEAAECVGDCISVRLPYAAPLVSPTQTPVYPATMLGVHPSNGWHVRSSGDAIIDDDDIIGYFFIATHARAGSTVEAINPHCVRASSKVAWDHFNEVFPALRTISCT